MYPFRRNRTAPQPLSIREKEATPEILSQDQRLIELLEIAMQESVNLAQEYQTLMEQLTSADDIALLRNSYLDQLKHYRQLQELYYVITGQTGDLVKADENKVITAVSGDLLTNLQRIFLAETDSVNFYRDLLLALPEDELRDIMYEIVTDKQNHSNRIIYLYTKNQ